MRRSICRRFRTFAATAGALITLALTNNALAAKFNVVHSFCSTGDGCTPEGGLMMDPAGNLFGTTYFGGRGPGTAYELKRGDSGHLKYRLFSLLCDRKKFCSGHVEPIGNLIVDTAGNFYGVAADNGGLVFELSPPTDGIGKWPLKVLYRFCSQANCTDGTKPLSGLSYAGKVTGVPYDGNSPLFGVTGGGGTNDHGTVFSLTLSGGSWTEAVLYSFCSQGGSDCTDGGYPGGGLLMDQAGNIYGTTSAGGGNGGASGSGILFELSPANDDVWSYTVLYRFCSLANCADGAYPFGDLTIDASGNLLGGTGGGGTHCVPGCGVLYKLSPNGANSQETVIYSFCAKKNCADGVSPIAPPVIDENGNLFGTTVNGGGHNIDKFGFGGGVAYELSGSTLNVLHHFCALANCADGEYPQSALVMDSSGNLYSTTERGGDFDGGTVFRARP